MKNLLTTLAASMGMLLLLQAFPVEQAKDVPSLTLPHVSAEIGSNPEVKIPILMIHIVRPEYPNDAQDVKTFGVTPDVFDKELSYLDENNYHVVSFDDIVAYFNYHVPLPEKPIVISFDDGWKDQYTYAFPLLKKHEMKATFFVFTNAMTNPHYLSWDNLKEMEQAGMSIESHSRTHPYLTKITDEKRLEDEIIGSKQAIESHLGTEVKYFAYPFGLYNDHIIDILKQAGFQAARSSAYGTVQTKDRLYALKVVNVNNSYETFTRNLEN